MNLQEIKTAVDAGKSVHWTHEGYDVMKGKKGGYFIRCSSNAHSIGLTWTDGVTLNGEESEFFLAEVPTVEDIDADEIRENVAKAFFASAWACMQEENEDADSFGGLEIMDHMPEEIDPAAYHAARTCIIDVERANRTSVAQLLLKCQQNEGGDCPADEEHFGHYLAMQAMGTGVGLDSVTDYETAESIVVPYCEFGDHSLEKDYPAFQR